MEKDGIMIILCMVVIIILISVLIDNNRKGCESCSICSFEINETKFGINGYYDNQGFYCIWTKDRTVNQIAGTEEHEKCHVLIDKDYEHFCGVDDV